MAMHEAVMAISMDKTIIIIIISFFSCHVDRKCIPGLGFWYCSLSCEVCRKALVFLVQK